MAGLSTRGQRRLQGFCIENFGAGTLIKRSYIGLERRQEHKMIIEVFRLQCIQLNIKVFKHAISDDITSSESTADVRNISIFFLGNRYFHKSQCICL